MAKHSASNVIKNRPFLYSEVWAQSEYKNDIAFDSVLTVSENPGANCILRINLRLLLLPISPDKITATILKAMAASLGIDPNREVGYKKDWDKSSKMIKDWQGNEWFDFVQKFVGQAEKWNRKFWLIPPDDFPHFDIVQGKSVFRPNVTCEFKVQVVYTPMIAHHTVEVVNLYNPLDTYRSDNANYSTNDVKQQKMWSQDASNKWREHNNYNVIVHEIGHALGLPHIGQTKSLPSCTLALVFGKTGLPRETIPALYRDGIGAEVCYGNLASYGDADNVMGMGSKFAPENAQPWLDRLPYHLSIPITMSKWKVSMNEVAPMSLVGFYQKT